MKKISLAAMLVTVLFQSKGQFVNNGAIVTVQPGGYIFCAGSFSNNQGTLTNNGRIEVQGNFLNTASYSTTTNDDSLILSGSANSTINNPSSPIAYLTINKSTVTAEVKLAAPVTVNRRINLLKGKFTTDPIANPSFALNAPDSTIFTFGTNEEIIGKVVRTNWKPGSLIVFNHTNFRLSTTGGTAPTSITTLMLPQTEGGDPSLNEREVKRRMEITATGGTGYSSTLRLPYLLTEINTNLKPFIVPWKYSGSEWSTTNATLTIDTANNYITATGVPSTIFSGEWKLADNKYTFNASAALRGPWNGSAMNTTLLSGSVIPLSQPYTVSPWNYTGTESVSSMPTNVVDWVLVELRKPSSGLAANADTSTIIGRKAGFLLSNGSIVNTDGITPLSFTISKQGTAFMVVRHRNHLGLISNAIPSNSTGSFSNDFTQLANVYKPSGASSDPVVLLSGTTGKYGMWAGDANKNGAVNITDVNAIKIAASQALTGYIQADVNLSNSTNITDVNLAKLTMASAGTGSGARPILIRTNIPDGVYNFE